MSTRNSQPALCRWLRERGHEADHVADLGLLAASDALIAARAEADGAVLISKDEDFVTLRLPDRFGLLWLRCGNSTNAALSRWIAARWDGIDLLLKQGERFHRGAVNEMSMQPTRLQVGALCPS